MRKWLLYRFFVTILCAWIYGSSMAQHEHVAVIDAITGKINKFDSIPGVMYIAPHADFDDHNRRFVFIGRPPDNSSSALFSIDAITGKVLTKAILPKSPTLISLRHDNASHVLYGITVQSGIYTLVTIDVNTGIYTKVNTIPDMESMAEEMIIDHTNHRIFLNCISKGRALICLDMNGNLISKIALPNISDLQYDRNTNKLYGLHYTGTVEQLQQVDISTGVVSTISNLPADVVGIYQYSTTYDESNHRYFFASSNGAGVARLYAVDAYSGAVISNPIIPVTNAYNKDNVLQFRYSNSLKQLYSLHWKAAENTGTTFADCSLAADTKIHYNAAGNFLAVDKTPTTCVIKMTLYTELGQVVMNNRLIENGYNQVRLPFLASGFYFYTLSSENKILKSEKIMLPH